MLKILWMSAILAAVPLADPLFARESVCLTSGFCLNALSHTRRGAVCVLLTGTGTTEFPANQIATIEVIPDLPTAGLPRLEPPSPLSFDDLLNRAALGQGLEPEFVRSVARIESNLRQDAVSNKGAIGLMQLMPGTAAILGVDARNAAENTLGGARFLRELLLRYHGDATLALAAYNAGPGSVQKYSGIPPYLETRRYINRVLRQYKKEQDASRLKAASRTTSATN